MFGPRRWLIDWDDDHDCNETDSSGGTDDAFDGLYDSMTFVR